MRTTSARVNQTEIPGQWGRVPPNPELHTEGTGSLMVAAIPPGQCEHPKWIWSSPVWGLGPPAAAPSAWGHSRMGNPLLLPLEETPHGFPYKFPFSISFAVSQVHVQGLSLLLADPTLHLPGSFPGGIALSRVSVPRTRRCCPFLKTHRSPFQSPHINPRWSQKPTKMSFSGNPSSSCPHLPSPSPGSSPRAGHKQVRGGRFWGSGAGGART